MNDIDEIKANIERLEARKNELENGENTDEYDEMLDEEGEVHVAGLTFMPSQIVKEMDPTAYRCGLNDYNDSELNDLEDQLTDLRDDLKRAEAEEQEAAE